MTTATGYNDGVTTAQLNGIQYNDRRHNCTQHYGLICPFVAMFCFCHAPGHYAECRYPECRGFNQYKVGDKFYKTKFE